MRKHGINRTVRLSTRTEGEPTDDEAPHFTNHLYPNTSRMNRCWFEYTSKSICVIYQTDLPLPPLPQPVARHEETMVCSATPTRNPTTSRVFLFAPSGNSLSSCAWVGRQSCPPPPSLLPFLPTPRVQKNAAKQRRHGSRLMPFTSCVPQDDAHVRVGNLRIQGPASCPQPRATSQA